MFTENSMTGYNTYKATSVVQTETERGRRVACRIIGRGRRGQGIQDGGAGGSDVTTATDGDGTEAEG